MIYGYARVSTSEQNLHLQTDALKKGGCTKLFYDKISAVKERPELIKLFEVLKKGDTLMVWKLDRLGRSLKHLVKLIEELKSREVTFISLCDGFNTSSAQGRFFFHVIASLCEFERELIKERTQAGLAAARARGRLGGRPKGLSIEKQLKVKEARRLHKDTSLSIDQILSKLQIKRATFYNYLKKDLDEL
jgi:DNA invertase Pin-like site-specific DNA recombinase